MNRYIFVTGSVAAIVDLRVGPEFRKMWYVVADHILEKSQKRSC